ncbi:MULTISPECIES: F0F1 ATP synthase subunit delta [unclassified Acidovorax]|uniref:F0F1 ATP synthase subunit delta n=1 Tax=unclassified Acidovorax TaxID=2684926 RepID=UPI001C4628E2|nr:MULTISPECIES: F0F1 ATP synthase subunit delta [unclassified Acidovorax]MBV7463048.1 F0F1 ATP synthase subunit delta [Acidovorax sp. sif0632]MBV7468074.1 F0F1 ATP synthase subunit delta [Acidovorax sp. sif0613]
MAELATIARPYADALFKAATAGAGMDLASIADWVDELAAIAANPQLRQLADNPKVTADQVFAVFTGVARSALSDTAKNFLRTVIDNGRINALPEVAAQFRALVNRRNGSSDAVVYSAFPMDSAALSEVSAALEKRFGRKLNLAVQQDESLIGGIRVVVGDEVLDTSVKARLEQMKAALTA